MAVDKKISSLNALEIVDLDLVNDSLVIVNQNETKKITPNKLLDSCVKSTNINNVVKLTQNEYNQLSSGQKDSATLYVITI